MTSQADPPFREKSAVILLLLREQDGVREILLQLRQNTGYADGQWDFSCSGHVEPGESMTQALCREAAEELCLSLAPVDLEFAVLCHRLKPGGTEAYLDGYFTAKAWVGTPRAGEPEKCGKLCWFPLDALPPDLMADRREALKNYLDHIPYSEMGWSHGAVERSAVRCEFS